MVANGQSTYYHADGLGSIVALTDAAKNVVQRYGYDSFGMVTAENPEFGNFYAFTGREWDRELGLYYYRARYYDPMEGRFVSRDPIGFAGGDVNLYGYVGNRVTLWKDPFGLEVYICGRPADFPAPFNQLNHEWLLTDTKEAGMGAVAGEIPGQNGNSDSPGVSVQVVDHTGQFDAENSQCEYVPTTDEECVNDELELGRSLGNWGTTNNCQTFVNNTINKCTKK